ncbi:hypothetical protein GCM10027280_58380 [Micromonospora polyrhachis]|uniref:Ig-like domain-containing protein n=1 Tax=Micromonospora polyrhachis TaxID=1282883 RepID=A0A7W7SLI8_9ACTN|nr:hypothetical protein [Micromonospora polyrhachis]MBB4956651.1 hypothetical protein [Micromonospora polyrhachis]
MAVRTRIVAGAVAALAAGAFAALVPGPASAASLVECESETGYWDCYLPSGLSSQRWYYDGVLLPGANDHSSAGGTCTPGTSHSVRVTFSGGRSSTNFTCQ